MSTIFNLRSNCLFTVNYILCILFFQRSSALPTCRSSSKVAGTLSKKSQRTQAQPNQIEGEEEEEEEDEEEQDLTAKKHRTAEHVGQIRKQRVIHLFVL